MEDANSAMERATNPTKQQGINHPKTNPTWPPNNCFKSQHGGVIKQGFEPLTRPKENVDVTEAMTPIIEKAKATVSIRWHMKKLVSSRGRSIAFLPHRKFTSKFSLISKFSEFHIISANDSRESVTVRWFDGNLSLSFIRFDLHNLRECRQSQDTSNSTFFKISGGVISSFAQPKGHSTMTGLVSDPHGYPGYHWTI